MLCLEPLKVCCSFIEQVNESLLKLKAKPLSRTQRLWLSICISGIIVTNTVCWQKFERAFLGGIRANTLSKLFCRGLLDWSRLLQASVLHIFSIYDISSGVLCLDDTANPRSKNTQKISGVHVIKDERSGGYIKGQELVFLLLVTDKVTLPESRRP